jgi:hypothetical protein
MSSARRLVSWLSDGAEFQIDAVLEHALNLEKAIVFGTKSRGVFDLAKGGLKDGETVPGFQHVKEVLGFNAAHGGLLPLIRP